VKIITYLTRSVNEKKEIETSSLFYTDGLVEAHNNDRKMFGAPRLQHLLKSQLHTGGLNKFLLDELQSFTGEDWEQEDDITLVMVRKTA